MRHLSKLIACMLVLIGPLGCKTQLETPGVYNGDRVLYDADLTITTAFTLIDSVLLWESNNRELLSAIPEIRKACDKIRIKAPPVLQAAINARDAYSENRTTENRLTLDGALSLARSVATDAAAILQDHGL